MNMILDRFSSLDPDDVTSRSMGCAGEDVLLSPKARSKFDFSIECKNTERFNINKAWEQAKANSGASTPIVFYKRNHSKPLAIVDAEWFINNWKK